VPHLRLARSSLQTQARCATFDAPYKFAPHCSFVATKLDERGADIFICAAPHGAMSTHGTLDIAAAKDTLESGALCQGRLGIGKCIHLVKPKGDLLDIIVIRPSFQGRVGVMRDRSLR
jgi:hypothetical protein